MQCQSQTTRTRNSDKMSEKMKIQITIQNSSIRISDPMIADIYYIEQSDNNRFYITSNNGYNGYEGEGHENFEKALKLVKGYIKNYFADRCEKNPKGF